MRGAKQKNVFEISDLRREILHLRFVWGGVLIYFHAYVGSGYFRGFKILHFNILGGFRKLNIFGSMKIL